MVDSSALVQRSKLEVLSVLALGLVSVLVLAFGVEAGVGAGAAVGAAEGAP